MFPRFGPIVTFRNHVTEIVIKIFLGHVSLRFPWSEPCSLVVILYAIRWPFRGGPVGVVATDVER